MHRMGSFTEKLGIGSVGDAPDQDNFESGSTSPPSSLPGGFLGGILANGVSWGSSVAFGLKRGGVIFHVTAEFLSGLSFGEADEGTQLGKECMEEEQRRRSASIIEGAWLHSFQDTWRPLSPIMAKTSGTIQVSL